MLKGVYNVVSQSCIRNMYRWLIVCVISQSMSGPSTVYVKRFSSSLNIMSHFSNNYLRFIYVLGYTERLAFRRLIVIYKA